MKFPRSFLLVLLPIVALAGCGSNRDAANPLPKPADRVASQSALLLISREPLSAEAKETFSKIRTTFDQARRGYVNFSAHVLAMSLPPAVPSLPEIPVAASNEQGTWARVTLNESGLGIDAVRFISPLPQADLVCAVALSQDDAARIEWLSITRQHAAFDQSAIHTYVKRNITIGELPLPASNAMIFNHLTDGQLSQRDAVLTVMMSGEAPMDIYIKLMVYHQHESLQVSNPQDAARALHMTLPFQFTSAASLTDLATEKLEVEGTDAALAFMEQELDASPDAKAALYYVSLAHNLAIKLSDEDKGDLALPLFLKAATRLRTVSGQDEVSQQVHQMLPSVLYNEACALALTGKTSEAVTSLREAVDAGMRDVALIRGDDDLSSLHEHPEFQRIVAELEER